HAPDVRGRTAFTEARVEREIQPKPVGQGPCPSMALERSRPMKRYDRRSLANRLYDGRDTVDVKRERVELHSFPPSLPKAQSFARHTALFEISNVARHSITADITLVDLIAQTLQPARISMRSLSGMRASRTSRLVPEVEVATT